MYRAETETLDVEPEQDDASSRCTDDDDCGLPLFAVALAKALDLLSPATSRVSFFITASPD